MAVPGASTCRSAGRDIAAGPDLDAGTVRLHEERLHPIHPEPTALAQTVKVSGLLVSAPKVAVICAVPAPTELMKPVLDTVAADGLSDAHVVPGSLVTSVSVMVETSIRCATAWAVTLVESENTIQIRRPS